MSEKDYVSTDLQSIGSDYLEMTLTLVTLCPRAKYMWQFVIISLYHSLYSMCVCLLSGYKIFHVYKCPIIKKRGEYTPSYISFIQEMKEMEYEDYKAQLEEEYKLSFVNGEMTEDDIEDVILEELGDIEDFINKIPDWKNLSLDDQKNYLLFHEQILPFNKILEKCRDINFINPPLQVSNKEFEVLEKIREVRNNFIHCTPNTLHYNQVGDFKEWCLSVARLIERTIEMEKLRQSLSRVGRYNSCRQCCKAIIAFLE